MKIVPTLALLLIPLSIIGWLVWGIRGSTQNNNRVLEDVQSGVDRTGWESKNPNVLVIGNANAKATIYEYADFKCPECAKFHQEVGKKIRQAYVDNGRVKIVFRPYPVFASDGGDLLAGAYCAQEQKKLEAYHDVFFDYMWENHFKNGDYDKAIEEVLVGEVRDRLFDQIGLDKAAYTTCVDSKRYEGAYFEDLLRSGPDEIQGTPSFVIGGQKVVGQQPFSVFKTLIDLELQAAGE